MTNSVLEKRPYFYFGPSSPDAAGRFKNYKVPPDYDTNPFKYLPAEVSLSDAELKLAEQYENGDFSGGYMTSQIACFRRPKPKQRHDDRRAKFQMLRNSVDAEGLVLPPAFIELVETDNYIDRLRHNTIWLRLPDEIVPLPDDPAQKMFLMFGGSSDYGGWYLLLSPDGTHVVAYCNEPVGLVSGYPPGRAPDIADCDVYQCAETFCEWIVIYFADCVRGDDRYEELLLKHPGI